MRPVRAAGRLWGALMHALAGLFTIWFHFPRMSMAQREAAVQRWAARMLGVLGIDLIVHGQPCAAGPMLLVCNHISWLDILVIHAARYCRFVSKSDVKHWPLVGTLATGAGTLYIERSSRRDTMRVVHHMAASLKAGEVVAIFPEGTSTDGLGLLPFHANLIQAAISAHAPVQPMALSFVEAATGAYSPAPNYIGDDTLVQSLWRTLSAPRLAAVVRFGDPQTAEGRDRRSWASDLREAVGALHGTDEAMSSRT
jgi:1-acyl-sn-glycerol-3-phosphate acyltransferase